MSARANQIADVAKSAIFVTVATAALAFSQWAIMAAIARVDGADDLGRYALAQAYTIPAMFFAWLGIRQQVIMRPNDRLEDLLFLRITFPIAVYALTIGIAFQFNRDGMFRGILVATIITKYVEGFFDFDYGRMQGNGKAGNITLSAFLRLALMFAAFFVVYHFSRNLLLSLYVNICLNIILLIAMSGRTFLRSIDFRKMLHISRRNLKDRLKIGLELLPLSFSALVGQLNVSAPRFVIEGKLGPEALGHYSAIMALIAIAAIAAASIGHATLPKLRAAADSRNARSFAIFLLGPLAIVQISCLIGAILAHYIGAPLVTAIYGPDFGDAGDLAVLGALVAGPMFNGIIAMPALTAIGAYRSAFWIQIATLLAVTALTYWLSTQYGIGGALVASGLAAIFQITLVTAALMIHWRRPPRAA